MFSNRLNRVLSRVKAMQLRVKAKPYTYTLKTYMERNYTAGKFFQQNANTFLEFLRGVLFAGAGSALFYLMAVKSIDDYYINMLIDEGVEYNTNGNLELALLAFDTVLKIDGKSALAHYNKGVVLQKLGKYNEAIRAYDQAIQFGHALIVIEALLNKGVIFSEAEQFTQALNVFNEVIKMDPKYYPAYFNKACTLARFGKFEEAIQMFNMAIKYEPNDKISYYYKGLALCSLNRQSEAIEAFKSALKIDPTYPEALETLQKLKCADKQAIEMNINKKYPSL